MLMKLTPGSFYTHRSQKRKNDSEVISHFVFLGSTRVRAARKHIGEIDPWNGMISFD